MKGKLLREVREVFLGPSYRLKGVKIFHISFGVKNLSLTCLTFVCMVHFMKKLSILLLICSPLSALSDDASEALGERMFNDIRFSEYFMKKSKGNVNYELKVGSPELDTIVIDDQESPSPFAGTAMSCASCHMVDQAFESNPGGMRGYNDFARRTKIPARVDGKKFTLRNTPTLVGIGSKYARNRFSHHDGEFHDHSQTVLGNFTGRNMGWIQGEREKALKNIVSIIRNDNGLGELAQEFGGSYKKVLLSSAADLSDDFRLSSEHRVDITKASDEEIIKAVTFFVTEYLNGIDFEKNDSGEYTGSPYDEFLKINKLSPGPKDGQTNAEYTRELLKSFSKLENPKFIKAKRYETYGRDFGFNELEWQGLKVFFNLKNKNQSRGMCVSCHMPPMFTDQFFHNMGTTQAEYDGVHGKGSFNKLLIPGLKERQNQFFSNRANVKNTNHVDLGMWNFFAREGKGILTDYVTKRLCRGERDCSGERLLPFMIGRIKTPTLRNLGQSGPYLHNGSAKNFDHVLEQYMNASDLMRNGQLRNGAPQLRMMRVKALDKKALGAFLNTLNSEYE